MFSWNRQSNRKWEKRPQLYRGRFFLLKRLAQISLVLCSCVAVISLFLYFRDSDTLYIRHIEVLGDLRHITKDEVVRLAGIGPNDKLFSISLKTVTKNILGYPWIAEARVRREFPDTIQIHVTERDAVALLQAGGLYYVDAEGKVFKRLAAEEDADYPVITGFGREFATRYPQLSKIYLKRTLAFLRDLKGGSFYAARPISEIRFDPVFGYTVYTLQDPLEIYYGLNDIPEKQLKLEKFAQSRQFDSARFVRLDLDARGKIVTRGVKPQALARVSRAPGAVKP